MFEYSITLICPKNPTSIINSTRLTDKLYSLSPTSRRRPAVVLTRRLTGKGIFIGCAHGVVRQGRAGDPALEGEPITGWIGLSQAAPEIKAPLKGLWGDGSYPRCILLHPVANH